MAAALQANAVPAAVPAPADQANHYKAIKVLRNSYLEKQRDVEGPTNVLAFIASLIATMAIVVLGNITTFLGVFGIALCSGILVAGLVIPRLRSRLDQSNKLAADALIAPGFYDFAMRDPRQLANAELINATFVRFLAGRPQ